MFQDFNLLDTLTLEENIGLALTLNHQDPNGVRRRVAEVAALLGIQDVLGKFPLPGLRRAEAAGGLRPGHGGRPVPAAGGRSPPGPWTPRPPNTCWST